MLMDDYHLNLNPEKYGMMECKHCNGYGSSLKEEQPKCSKCSGTGLQEIEELEFHTQTNCDRCNADLGRGRTTSWFTEQTICMKCSASETRLRSYLPDWGRDLEGCGYVPERPEPKPEPKPEPVAVKKKGEVLPEITRRIMFKRRDKDESGSE